MTVTKPYPRGIASGTGRLAGEKAILRVPTSCTPFSGSPSKASCAFQGPLGALAVPWTSAQTWTAGAEGGGGCIRWSDLLSLPLWPRIAPEVIVGAERGPVILRSWGSCLGLFRTLAITPSQGLDSWPFGTYQGRREGPQFLNA